MTSKAPHQRRISSDLLMLHARRQGLLNPPAPHFASDRHGQNGLVRSLHGQALAASGRQSIRLQDQAHFTRHDLDTL